MENCDLLWRPLKKGKAERKRRRSGSKVVIYRDGLCLKVKKLLNNAGFSPIYIFTYM